MCDCLSEQPTFFESSMPRARKEHRCCECRRTIRVGEVYERATGCWPTVDGFESFATCLDCLEAHKLMSDGGDCRCYGELVEYILNVPEHEWTLPLIRVVERYRAYWRQKRKATA